MLRRQDCIGSDFRMVQYLVCSEQLHKYSRLGVAYGAGSQRSEERKNTDGSSSILLIVHC